jgi:ferredoxin
MGKIKIVHEIDECIGCGACAAVCPDNWEMKGSKAHPKKTEVADIGCNQQAADVCPSQCIKIKK